MDDEIKVLMDFVKESRDRQQIIELLTKFIRGIDRLDDELLRSLYHPDAIDEHGMFSGTMDEWVPWCIDNVRKIGVTSHYITNTIIELKGENARTETYYLVAQPFLGKARGGVFDVAADQPDGAYILAGGRYLDHVEKRDGVWKITRRHVIYDWQLAPSPPEVIEKLKVDGWVFGKHGKEDASYENFAGKV